MRRLLALRDKVRRNIGEVGITGAARRAAVKTARAILRSGRGGAHEFDRKYGTDTSGTIEPAALQMPGDRAAHAVRYQTAIVEVFDQIVGNLPVAYDEFTFIDLGSGKGRALLLASSFPFKRIIGVELSAVLHEIAVRNLAIYREPRQLCRDVSCVCEDAARWAIPREQLVVYLFNPFDELVMQAVMANVEASVRSFPRDVLVAYLKPIHRHLWDRSPYFQVERETERYVLYRSRLDASGPVSPLRA